ncbi:hypothetical protein H0H93_014967 [Arthromyces matolae]|nr:hypothetical protein H0H93_014967 [Arthromyces matolae]
MPPDRTQRAQATPAHDDAVAHEMQKLYKSITGLTKGKSLDFIKKALNQQARELPNKPQYPKDREGWTFGAAKRRYGVRGFGGWYCSISLDSTNWISRDLGPSPDPETFSPRLKALLAILTEIESQSGKDFQRANNYQRPQRQRQPRIHTSMLSPVPSSSSPIASSSTLTPSSPTFLPTPAPFPLESALEKDLRKEIVLGITKEKVYRAIVVHPRKEDGLLHLSDWKLVLGTFGIELNDPIAFKMPEDSDFMGIGWYTPLEVKAGSTLLLNADFN